MTDTLDDIISNINTTPNYSNIKELNTFLNTNKDSYKDEENLKKLTEKIKPLLDVLETNKSILSEKKTINIKINNLDGILIFENEYSASKYILNEIIKNIEYCLCTKPIPIVQPKETINIEMVSCDTPKSPTIGTSGGGSKKYTKTNKQKKNKTVKKSFFNFW
jgi:cell fate (sporulation/competence/biofilm development) regulator YlbF (YheA/YmcA/DUF963 family)